MDKLTMTISNSLAENKFIKPGDIDICRYGIEMFVICVLEMCSILFISAIIGNFTKTIIYFVGFMPIRVYGGGYHADTRLKCFIILLTVYAAFSFVNTYELLPKYSICAITMMIINMFAIYLWSPLPNGNKSVNKKERQLYRKMSLLFSTIGCIITIVIIETNFYNAYTQAFLLGLFSAFTSLIAGKIKNTLRGGEKNE